MHMVRWSRSSHCKGNGEHNVILPEEEVTFNIMDLSEGDLGIDTVLDEESVGFLVPQLVASHWPQ